MNSHDIGRMVKMGLLPSASPRPRVARPKPPRETTEDEHNAIWAALTMLANGMDGRRCTAADVDDIRTCGGDNAGLSADQVWALRDSLDTVTIHLGNED